MRTVHFLTLSVVAATFSQCAGQAAAVESIHFGYNSAYPSLTDGIRLSTRIGTAYWSQNKENLDPEDGATIPYAYHDGYIEDLGTSTIPTAAAMAQRWREIMTGQGDSRTGVSGESIGFPNIIILDELNSNFQDSNRGPLLREALRLYTLPTAQGGYGGTRDDIVAYVQTGLSQGTGVTSGLYDDIIYAANNYMRALALEVYATEDGWRTGIESPTNPTQYPTGDAYLGVRLTGPLRNWMNKGLSAARAEPILNVSNIADADSGGDFNAFLNREFWFVANGRYSATSSQIDPNIKTAMRRGVGSYTWAPDTDNSNDPYQLLTSQVTRDAYFETMLKWYSVNGLTALYQPLKGDYDSDGDVDVADYLVWRASFGSSAGPPPADGSGNGIVDMADYVLWRKNLGRSISGAGAGVEIQAVPEPAMFVAVDACTWLLLLRARTGRRVRSAR